MKQLKLPLFNQRCDHIVADVSQGQSVVFTLQTSTYQIIRDISLSLSIGGPSTVPYKVTLNRSESKVHCFGASMRWFGCPDGDTYIVVRIDRAMTSPNYFTTYINDDLIAITEPQHPYNDKTNGAFLEVNWGTCYTVAGVLTIFDESEREKVAAFAEAMRNPEAGYFLVGRQALEESVRIAERVKHYKFSRYFGGTTDIAISDGHSFVFTFPTLAYISIVNFSVSLNSGNTESHTVRLCLAMDAINIYPGTRVLSSVRLSKEDTNVVIRVVRTTTSPPTFATYVNGDLVATTEALNGTGGLVDHASLTKSCPTFGGHDLIPVLTVFDESESGKAAAFAEAMRNPDAGCIESINKAAEDCKKAFEENEKSKQDKEKALEEKETALGDKEWVLRDKERVLEEKEKAVEARERAVAERENKPEGHDSTSEQASSGGDGNGERWSSGANVRPPDLEMVNDSSAMGWPRAVRRVLSSEFANVKQIHDTLMSDWVVARGDNISPAAYDYFVYSHGVAWPKAVLETTTHAKLAEIREGHAKIMEVLGY